MDNAFSNIIAAVAMHYWGNPNAALSKPTELRFGNNGSKSVDVSKATWFDFEDNIGGGVVDLIRHYEPGVNISERLEGFGMQSNKKTTTTETVWTYYDELGTPKYQVIRQDGVTGKTYRQRHFTSDGSLEWGMAGVTALPYRLPLLKTTSDTVFIVEGEKCADAVIQLGLTATTNHGGANKWFDNLSPYFKNRAVVIIPDNDEVGMRHARRIASNLNGLASIVKILTLPDLQPKGDVYDWICGGGTRNKLIELANAAPVFNPLDEPATAVASPVKSPSQNKFELMPWSELPEVETQWLVDDLIPAGGLSALFGKPGSGKSFIALDLAAAVGSGRSFFGRDVLDGDVVYIAGEGGAGLKARRDAIKKAYGIHDTRVFFLRAQLDLRSNEKDREALLAEIERLEIKPVLVIIDTLSRAFAGGNENASEDMGSFIAHATTIQLRIGAAVLIVHHSGKDEARGQRGHSSLNAAIDAELEIQKLSELGDNDRRGKITVTKQKDGEDGTVLNFRLDVVQLKFVDASRTSLVVVPLDENAENSGKSKKALTGHRRTALEALKRSLNDAGEVRSLNNIPSDRRSVTISLWRETFYMMVVSDGTKSDDAKQKAFRRASQSLIEERTIGFWADYAWIPDG